MKPVAIIPAAGGSNSLRPQTHTVPKALINVAGKPILGHIVDTLLEQGISRIVVVVGYMGDRIRDFVDERYRNAVEVVQQPSQLGVGHAVLVTRALIREGPVMIMLGDTLVEPDWPVYFGGDQVILGVKEIDDPRRFGVVEVQGDQVLRLVEKPVTPSTNLAMVGLYYLPDAAPLYQQLQDLFDNCDGKCRELHLTAALQRMLTGGQAMRTSTVDGWFDCGEPGALLTTNQHLLSRVPPPTPIRGVTLIPPVFIAPTARIENSVLGPYVSVADRAVIRRAIVRDAIVNESALVEDILLENSVVGEKAIVRGSFLKINVGDSSEVNLSG
jgi:glucose-1-phosphate thymidylyltransferase